MNKKPKKVIFTLEQLIDYNNGLYYVFFDLVNFQRKYRKFFKFCISSEIDFGMHFKASKQGIRITVKPDNYYHVFSTKSPHLFEFCCLSQRELIDKLIMHKLF